MKKHINSIRKIGLVANPDKVECRGLIQSVARRIARRKLVPMADTSTMRLADLKLASAPDVSSLASEVDLLIVFGGDGTMLSMARAVAGLNTPIFGINVGGLGFLTAVSAHEVNEGLDQIWAGNYTLETRPLIEADGKASGQPLSQVALNDFVISRGSASRLIELEVCVDGEPLTRYRCDGLIISSPTGSTAYSLAAGGAVVSPAAEVFAITPICPHTLSNRSVIVHLQSTVQVKVLSKKLEVYLTADGQVQIPMAALDVISVRQSPQSIRLVRLAGSSFFSTLRKKLSWSGSNV